MNMLFYLLSLLSSPSSIIFFFFFNDTATTEIYTLSLHDALPIYLLFAAGQCAGALSPSFCQPREGREYAMSVVVAVLTATAIGTEIEILENRHVREDASALWHVDKAACDDRGRLLALDRGIAKSDRAGPWP